MIKEFIRKKILNRRTQVIKKKFNFLEKIKYNRNLLYKINSYGEKNKNKIFYVIQRSPGGGMFSNLNYVINHLLIAKKYNFVPIVDMENFPTFYNEKVKIFNSYNAWDYYFEKINQKKLSEVYKSKLVIFSHSKYSSNFYFDGFRNLSNEHKEITKKKIKFKKYLLSEAKNYLIKNFKNYKVLGVHFRGTDQKRQERHPFPATVKQIENNINYLIYRFKYKKIFLVTEEKEYLDYFKRKFGKKLIFYNSHTSKNQNIFLDKTRAKHRYKIGKENIINMLLLSNTNHILCAQSNLAEASIFFSKKKIKITKIDNGKNSDNIFFAQVLWYIKKNLPRFLGGFKI